MVKRKKKSYPSKTRLSWVRNTRLYGVRFFGLLGLGTGLFWVYQWVGGESGSIPVLEAPGYPIRTHGVSLVETPKLAPHVDHYMTGKSTIPSVERLLPPPEKPILDDSVDKPSLGETSVLSEENTIEDAIEDVLDQVPVVSVSPVPGVATQKPPSVSPPHPISKSVQSEAKSSPSPKIVPINPASSPRPASQNPGFQIQLGPIMTSRQEVLNNLTLFQHRLSLPPGSSLQVQREGVRGRHRPSRYRIVVSGLSSMKALQAVGAQCKKKGILWKRLSPK